MDSFKSAYKQGHRTIAVDLDDVLSQTNVMVCRMHNEVYGSDMVLNDFQHYLYWQNRGWGNPEETFTKVRHLYASGLMERTPPIPDARTYLHQLRDMGFNLVLVTARSESQRPGTEHWLAEHYPGVFNEMHFTGAFTQVDVKQEDGSVVRSSASPPAPVQAAGLPNGVAHAGVAEGSKEQTVKEVQAHQTLPSRKKRSKADVAHSISAILLIDDSIENALDCATAHPPVPVLLFGAYPWNRHVSKQETAEDFLAHAERVARGIDSEEAEELGERIAKEGQERQVGWTGESEGQVLPSVVRRVRDWQGVVEVVKELVEGLD